MRILVTNDDGIHSPGLTALAKALSRVGEVWVVAPDRERTAVAHSVTLHKPLRVQQLGTRIYAVNGTPVDCVNLAVLNVLPAPPDLLVSGINKGVNLGDDVLYSGTVSAAMEGTILGVPSMAVSQEGQKHFYFDAGARYAVRIARLILKEGLPDETLVNLNIPNRPFSRSPECESPVSAAGGSTIRSLKRSIRMAGSTIGLPGLVCHGAEARTPTMRRLSKARFRSLPFISIRRIMEYWIDSGNGKRCAGQMRVGWLPHRNQKVNSGARIVWGT